ncbi:ATPase [Planomonospora parontospora subsp. parontospora]|uniref:histidine kinase n=2 Tax=Planomonospora parontospora TaxID=58119 RepID=A0AA37F1R5_9ACTN|nr:sensor histidine kinase [Planomonospora parontospora]GGK45832.1 ATPase [Planomonospora parontospora]GII06385.1 ATPase [Planomonospora parontospora subsp. parontospora]
MALPLPLSRHLRTVPRVDLLIGAAIIALGTLEAFTVATEYGAAETPELWWIGQALVTGVLVWFRRKAPVAVFILMILVQYAWHRQGYEHCQVWQLFSLLLVFHTVGAELPFRPGLAWAVTGVLVFDSGAVDHRWLPAEEVIFLTVVFGSAYLTGLAVNAYATRARRLAEHAVRLERDRERRAAEAVAEERTRIARELHDVVAHSVSMMVMQAGVLRRRGGGDADALLGIERSGREAVEELRVMLGALRMPLDEAIPQPGLDMLATTVASLASSGLRITLSVTGEPVRLAPGLDLSAYRIAQEALTNAVKHADESEISVRVAYLDDSVEVEVLDTGGAGSAPELSTGNGLIGMRERATLFGGTFEAGPRAEGGFRVHARLPLSLEVLV